jgi:hypothetical protein
MCLLCSLAGISRSVTIAAAYIIAVTGLSVAEALQAVRSSRTIANPNFGFQKQLYDFEVNGGAEKVTITILRSIAIVCIVPLKNPQILGVYRVDRRFSRQNVLSLSQSRLVAACALGLINSPTKTKCAKCHRETLKKSIAHKIQGRVAVQISKKLWNQGLPRYLQILFLKFCHSMHMFVVFLVCNKSFSNECPKNTVCKQ